VNDESHGSLLSARAVVSDSLLRVIVNADDFGLDHSVNRGIALAFERGLVSSTSLMANQPGFDEAVDLADDLGLAQHVGVHVVLTSGMPLTEPIRRLERFCDADGRFRAWQNDDRVWRVSGAEREALWLELDAQVRRVRLAGLPVTHLDSHHHAHNDWAIGGMVIDLARRNGIQRVRIARNCGPSIARATGWYKRLFNWRLRRRGLAGTRWFGEARDWLALQAAGATADGLDDFEVMTHPVLDAGERLVDPVSGGQELDVVLAPVTPVRSAVSHAGARFARS
jgi:chitin disaccharide deacetylase